MGRLRGARQGSIVQAARAMSRAVIYDYHDVGSVVYLQYCFRGTSLCVGKLVMHKP